MTQLRQRMLADLRVRNYSPRTQEIYIHSVARFAAHFGQSPDQLTGEHIRSYLVHLVEEKHVSWSLFNQIVCALRFFYRITLGRDDLSARSLDHVRPPTTHFPRGTLPAATVISAPGFASSASHPFNLLDSATRADQTP